MLELPTYTTYNGEEGYSFAFVAGPASCETDIGGPEGSPDGATTLSDLALLLASYGLCAGDAGFVAAADFTGAEGEPDGALRWPIWRFCWRITAAGRKGRRGAFSLTPFFEGITCFRTAK